MKISYSRNKIVVLLIIILTIFPSLSVYAAGQLSSNVYSIDRMYGTLKGVNADTSVSQLKQNMCNETDDLSVFSQNGDLLSEGRAATGMTLKLKESGAVVDSLTIVVVGDASGDGSVSVLDYTQLRLHMLGLKLLSGANWQAADVGENGTLSIADYTQMRLAILGLSGIGDALPLSGVLIGLDPGHQLHPNNELEPVAPGSSIMNKKVTSGTQGRYTRVPEYVVNLQVGLKLKTKLEELGATVIMTRTTHDVNISNSERAMMMNKSGVNCWLRIHADGSTDTAENGVSILVPTVGCMNTSDAGVQQRSDRLASCLISEVISKTRAYNRGLKYRSDQTGFCWSSVPVCNIEMGYLTNEAEDRLLVTDNYQNKIVDGLVDGFLKYYS